MSEKLPQAEQQSTPDTPKSRELFRGDINDAVIQAQLATGNHITPDWWAENVGNNGGTEAILQRFDDAYEHKVLEESGIVPESDGSRETMEEMAKEGQKESVAWEKYVPFGSEEYYRVNSERTSMLDYRFGEGGNDAEIIASINVDENEEAISGHEHNPEARSLKEIETAYTDYLARTPAESRLVVVEGSYQPGRFSSKEEGIKIRSESGMLQYIAERDQIPIESGEPSDEDIAKALEEQGISRSELASLYAVWGISSFIRQSGNSPDDLGAHIYHSAATAGLESFHAYSEEEKQAIIADGRQEAVMADIEAKAETLVEIINSLAADELHGAELLRIEDGKVRLNLDVDNQDYEAIDQALLELWTPESDGKLGAVTRAVNLYRDRYLFHKIIQASHEGKSPFVVYGGSHVVCLEPALKAYFDES